jgi:cation-transporting P-type ATPase I
VLDRLPSATRTITGPAGAIRDTAQVTARVLAAATPAPLRRAPGAAVARLARSVPDVTPPQLAAATRALLDLHPQRLRRRVWEGHGHAHIEVRGLAGGGQAQRIGTDVREELRATPGVRWAEINAVTGHVLVAFDEQQVQLETLLEAVRRVERAHGTRDAGFSWEQPVHPSDITPLVSATVELAADCVAVTAALVGRMTAAPALPSGARVGLIFLDLQPQLRRELARRIGPTNTDFLLALTYAAVLGLSQRPVGTAIDAIHRVQLLGEVVARRAVWERREPELCRTPEALPRKAPKPVPRPQPLPQGPIEAWAEKLGLGTALTAGAMLAITRNPGRAGDTVVAAVPRAARLGREAFATTAATDLADHGVLPLDASAYRRLDTISAIILDSSLLGGEATEPFGRALLDAARKTGARVLLTENADVADLVARADEVLPARRTLAAHVRRLQRDGHGVLVLSGVADDALAAADVGVAVVGQESSVCWSADLLCGPGLDDAWRILLLTAEARPLSEHVVRLSQAGSALGTLLTLMPIRPGTFASAPVYGAAVLGLVQGTWAARSATRRPVPRARIR